MKIIRSGANRDSGPSVIGPEKPATVGWAREDLTARICLDSVSDPGKHGEYDYEVVLNLADIATLLNELSRRGLQDSPGEISDGLSDVTRALNRLLAASTGLLPPEPRAEASDWRERLRRLRQSRQRA